MCCDAPESKIHVSPFSGTTVQVVGSTCAFSARCTLGCTVVDGVVGGTLVGMVASLVDAVSGGTVSGTGSSTGTVAGSVAGFEVRSTVAMSPVSTRAISDAACCARFPEGTEDAGTDDDGPADLSGLPCLE